MGFLDTIKDNLGSILPGTSPEDKSAIGLDMGSSSIKVVQLRKEKGKALLETYGEIALGPYASEPNGKAVHINSEIAAPAIRDLFVEANVMSRNAAISIPFTSAMTRVIKVPKLPKAQLEKMIPIEARKFIPMQLNEIILNWFVLPEKMNFDASEKRSPTLLNPGENRVEMQDVLIVAIHKDAVNNIQSIVRQSDMQVKFYELETFSVIRSSVEYELAPTMYIDVGALSTKIYIVEAGLLRFSHLLNLGSQNITENIMRSFTWPFEKAERMKKEAGLDSKRLAGLDERDAEIFLRATETAVNRIFTEVNRVLINYEKKNNRSIAKVILGGAGANLMGLVDYAEKKLSLPTEKAPAFAKVHTPAFLNDVLQSIGPDFAVAVGLALRRLNL